MNGTNGTAPPSPPSSQRASSAEPAKFKLLAELGRGGMATVYLAVARGPAGFNKNVVVKCLRPSLAAEPEFLEMFLAEARLAARINHPNAVQTNEVGFDGQFYYIVMEYIDGPSLESVIRKAKESFPINLHLFCVMEALSGLHYAHELKDFDGRALKVVHRDVSPHNVMLSYDGHVKLVDFGIAKAADSGGNTRTGIMKGKCAYMAAEQFGGHNVDRRADIFAAGVCLWQAITGTRLWKGLSDAEIFSRVSRGEIPSPKTVKPELPDALVKICMRALALSPEDRFATAADFLSALEQFLIENPAFRASSRDLAKYIVELFASERATMQQKIEEQLRQVSEMGQSLVSFQADSPSGNALISQSAALTPMNKSAMPKVIVAVVALLAIAVGVFFYLRSQTRAQLAKDSNTAGAVQAKVTVTASPPNAKIWFDDAPLAGNPTSATFTRDGLSHRVRAEAPGHARKTELVVLDSSNVSVRIELDTESKDDEVDPFGNKLTVLTLKAAPAAAHLYVDGVLLPSNPSVAKYPRDGKKHEIRADAPGFLQKSQQLTFDAARNSVTITLDKDPKYVPAPVAHVGKGGGGHKAADPVASPAEQPTPPPVVTAKAAEPTPKPGGKLIDRGDPWAK